MGWFFSKPKRRKRTPRPVNRERVYLKARAKQLNREPWRNYWRALDRQTRVRY